MDDKFIYIHNDDLSKLYHIDTGILMPVLKW